MSREPNTAFSGPDAPSYRRDVDGLRALAILPVVLFHAGIPGMGGGFIGVDVFFVISGYLITQVLERGAHRPLGAALADFYLRRCRRILPALVVMLGCVTLFAALLLLPADFESYGRFLALASGYLGNLAAWMDGGYFAASNARLLQHLWSIGIEEQFYLVYPLAFFACLRLAGARASWLLVLLTLASFTICVWGSYTHVMANFYSPVTRAWELLAGGALALGHWRGLRNSRHNELLAWLALGLLIASFAIFDARTRHPGLLTLLPCAATLLLLATGAARNTGAARLLSLPPLVFTGLISYSLYLWHAPLLSLDQYFFIVEPTPARRVFVLVTIYLVSVASWRWIETPLRRGHWLPSNRGFLALMLGTSAGLCALGVAIWSGAGWPQRFSPEIRTLVQATRYPPEVSRCMTFPNQDIAAGRSCEFGAGPRRPAVLWGDSHALALLPVFQAWAREQQVPVHFAGRSSCRPLIGMVSDPGLPHAPTPSGHEECASFNAAMLEGIERIDPAVVVLAAYWNLPDFLEPADAGRTALARARFQASVAETLRRLQGRHVCIVLDVPVRRYHVPYSLAIAQRRGISTEFLQRSRESVLAEQRLVDDLFRGMALDWRVAIMDPKEQFCEQAECRMQAGDGAPLYIDSNHLSRTGALSLLSPLARCMATDDRE